MDGIDNGAAAGGLAQEQMFARYRDPALAHEIVLPDWNPVLETMLGHRSVRRYTEQKLAPGVLETIVAAGQSAPSSSNLQAWSVVAVEDAGRKQRLAALAGNQKHVATAAVVLMFVADLSRLRALAKEQGQTSEGLDYLECFIIAVADASFAAQNILVAAQSLGLGGCYIGGMRDHPQEVAAEIGLPDEAFTVFGMTLGYPDPAVETDVKPRLPQNVVLHRERYEPPTAQDYATYDERLRTFRGEQGMGDTAWTTQAAGRIATVQRLTNREKLMGTLKDRGFGMK